MRLPVSAKESPSWYIALKLQALSGSWKALHGRGRWRRRVELSMRMSRERTWLVVAAAIGDVESSMLICKCMCKCVICIKMEEFLNACLLPKVPTQRMLSYFSFIYYLEFPMGPR